MKLVTNEKTKDYVDSYLSKEKVVHNIKEILEEMLKKFQRSNTKNKKKSKNGG